MSESHFSGGAELEVDVVLDDELDVLAVDGVDREIVPLLWVPIVIDDSVVVCGAAVAVPAS